MFPTSASRRLLVNGSPVTGLTSAYLDGTTVQLEDGLLEPGGAATTLWTLAVPASRNVTVEATLSASADDGSTGGHLDGTLVCTAKRYGSGVLAITSQSAALPWALNKPLWNPQFVVSSNNLLLQITPDAADTIQLRDGFVRYLLRDTSGDVAPPEHTSAWLLAQVQAGIGSKLLGLVAPEDFTLSGSDITAFTTAYGPTITTRAAKPQAITVGARRHVQFARNSSNTVYNASYGLIREAVYVLNTPSLPFSASETGFIISSNDFNYAFGQAAANTSTIVNAAATEYVDGVATNVLTESAQVVAVSYGANASTGLEIGGLNTLASYGFLEGSLGAMVFCNAALTNGERQAVEAALALYQAGA